MSHYTLPYKPITRALYRHPLGPSRTSPAVLFLLRLISPIYLRWVHGFSSIELLDTAAKDTAAKDAAAKDAAGLLSNWKDFQEGRTRLILAFRHPYGDEAQLFSFFFDVLLKGVARRRGIPLRGHPHARFIHGYEVALWGGHFIRWLLPRIGALPVYHVKADSAGIKNIRSVIKDGPSPVALAPEGQVSYRSETLPRLEPGTAQMGFWCAEELEKEGRAERVCILPLSVHYRFDHRDIKKVHKMLRRLERICGICSTGEADELIAERLEALDLKVLELAEGFYEKTYGKKARAKGRDERWAALRYIALGEGERSLGLSPSTGSNEIQRVYRLRQECWDRIYALDLQGKAGVLERSFADRRAGEAWFAMRHMEFVDITHYLDGAYLKGPSGSAPSFNRMVENLLNLGDLVSRCAGGNISHRQNLLTKKALIVAGRGIEMRSRLDEYRENRRQAVETVTLEMKQIFLDCIVAAGEGEQDNGTKG